VLDRDLPGIHGDTLCQTIVAADEPAMILMLTAAGTPDDRVAGVSLGADDYLPKPFHFPELVLRVRPLARRRSTAQRRTLDVAGIELDPLTGSVTRDGEAIDLTTKERAVLEALLTASPHPLSAEKLLQQAWDETPTRSPTPCASRSPGSDTNWESHKSSIPPPASGTGSRADDAHRIASPRRRAACPVSSK
jgi:DNA-binding response OmpR family regulator